VIQLAFKSVRVSDLSGAEGNDEDFVTLVVRRHPKLEEPVQIDVLPDEIKGLKNAGNLVVLEVRNGDTLVAKALGTFAIFPIPTQRPPSA